MNRKWMVFVIALCLTLSFGTALAQTFAPAVNYTTQVQPLGIGRGDFNEDGKQDLIVANASSSTVSLFLGNGDGSFETAISIFVGANPISVVAADFDGDGHLDVAVTLAKAQAFQILLGNGNGTFQAPITVPISGIGTSSIGKVVAADFNGDHRVDLAIATDLGIAVFMNNGSGGFTKTAAVEPAGNITNLAVADINRDGRPDLVATELAVNVNGDDAGNIFSALGNGDGTFQAVSQITQFDGSITGIATGDLDGDGRIDIVVSDGGGVTGGGTGTKPGGPVCTRGLCPLGIVEPPPSPVPFQGELFILLQQANGTFSHTSNVASDPTPGEVILSDLNGDGSLDIAEASSSTSSPALVIFHNQGNGTFTGPEMLVLPFPPSGLLSGPLSNTVALDIAATLPTGNEVSVLVNQGANTLSLTSSANPAEVAQPVTLSATVHPSVPSAIAGSVIFADGATTLGTSPVNSSGVSTLTTSFISAGNHPLVAVYSGSSVLVGGSSATLSQTVNPATATVTLAGSGTPTSFGQTVTLTITVTATGPGIVPTGTVNLLDGQTIILSGILDGSGKLILSDSSLSLGTHTIIAQYSGDTNYGQATSLPLTQTVNKSNASVVLSSGTNPSVFGQPIAFSVAVAASGGSGTPTGSVTLNDSGVPIGSLPLNSTGIASFGNISLSAGSHSVTASYSGDQNFGSGFSSPITQIVSKADSTTSLTSAPNPSTFGQPVLLTAIVAGVAAGTPTGLVTFTDGTTQLGSAALVNGKAILSTGSLGTGSHSISAAYTGDGNYNPSTASGTSGVSQTVGKSNSIATVSATPNPSSFGQNVAISAKIAPSEAGAGAPTGTVTFTDGTASLGTAVVNGSGVASINIASLVTGSHSLTATYGGDANFNAAQSTAYVLVVNKTATATALTSSMNPTTNASSITLNASVTATIGVPTGAVVLFDGSQQITTAQVDPTGKVNFPLTNLSVGPHNLTAKYSGDANFSSSLATLGEGVVDSHATVALTTSSNPQTTGSPVTFMATVNLALTGPAKDGTVTFTDGGKVLASVPLANSVASLMTKSLAVGQHQIVAAFQAGSSPSAFDGSSPVLVETIVAAPVEKNFTLDVQNSVASVYAGQAFTTPVTLTPVNGFTGPVTTICYGEPIGATCSLSPANARFDGKTPIKANLVITTTRGVSPAVSGVNGSHLGSAPSHGPLLGSAMLQFGIFPVALFGLVLLPGTKRRVGSLALCAMFAVSLTGCGSDSGSQRRTPTPRGTYTITVQAISGTIVHSHSVQLTVR